MEISKRFSCREKKVKEEFERTKSILNFQREEIERALQLDRKKYKDIVTECDSVLNFFQMIQTNPKIHNTDVFCKNSSIIESYNSEKSITFFNSDIDVYKILNELFSKAIFDKPTLSLLFSRLLFPSYYFDLYENILEMDLNENIILNIIKKSTSYEKFLYFLMQNWSLYKIEWLVK